MGVGVVKKLTATNPETSIRDVTWEKGGRKQFVTLDSGNVITRTPGNPAIWYDADGNACNNTESRHNEWLFDRYLKSKRKPHFRKKTT